MLLIVAQAHAVAPNLSGALVQGVVRDAQGVGQMGALVQVLSGNSATVGTAYTDRHGRYQIANLLPGKYMVRASATLFVPAMRDNLQLRTGGKAVVNLTLAALFETANWLPSQRRKADEPADDWKWTLRSTTNRPILRVLDDGNTVILTADNGEIPPRQQMQGRAGFVYASGGFGSGGEQMVVALDRTLNSGANLLMQARIGSTLAGSANDGAAPATAMTAGYERRLGFGESRTIVHYESHPEIGLMPGGTESGLQVMDIRTAQETDLGDQVHLELGGRIEAVHALGSAIQMSPFVRLTAHPGGSAGTWTLQYRLACSTDLQGFSDLDGAGDDVPVAVVSNGRLLLEQGRHQQFMVAHQIGRSTVRVSVFHDAMNSTAVAGGILASGVQGASAMMASAPIVFDSATGNLRALAGGYDGDGVSVAIDVPLVRGMVGGIDYASGDALTADAPVGGSVANAIAQLKPHNTQSAAFAVHGHLGATRIRASYHWQPSATVTAVNPYGDLGRDAYLSLTVRQPLRWRNHLPQGLDASIDVTNLLARGYRPFLSADGQTLYFAQSPRTMQAGLSFSF